MTHLQFFHSYNAIPIRIDDFLKFLLPLPHPVVIDVLSLLVFHNAHGQRNEL